MYCKLKKRKKVEDVEVEKCFEEGALRTPTTGRTSPYFFHYTAVSHERQAANRRSFRRRRRFRSRLPLLLSSYGGAQQERKRVCMSIVV